MAPVQVFLSYSHQDEPFLIELEKHLSTLKREGLVSTWQDRKIVPGQDWEKKIDGALQQTEIFVFLVSPDFIASDYCIGKEVTFALERHKDGDAMVVPVAVRPADWLTTPLGRIQGLPKDAIPISLSQDRDQAWMEVIKGLRTAISDYICRKEAKKKEVSFTGMSSALTAAIERLETRYGSEQRIGGIPTGLRDLDNLIDGIHGGDLLYIAAAPVMDRTALLISIMNCMFVDHAVAGVMFTLRQTAEQVSSRMCAALGGISPHAMQRGELEDEDWSSLTHALGLLNDTKISFVECASIDIQSLISKVDEYFEAAGGCQLVIIDQFEHVTGASKSNILATLGRYARAKKIAFLVASGLEGDPSVRPNKRPAIKDIGDWATLNEDLDIVIFVYQDEQYNPDSPDRNQVELIVAKNSRDPLGTVAPIRLTKGRALVSHRSLRGLKS